VWVGGAASLHFSSNALHANKEEKTGTLHIDVNNHDSSGATPNNATRALALNRCGEPMEECQMQIAKAS